MAKHKHLPTILGAQKTKYDNGGSITSMMNTIKNFGSTERDPTLGKNISSQSNWAALAGTIGSMVVDSLDMIDTYTDKNKDDYNPYRRIGLYGMGGHKFDGITGNSTITALNSGSMPAWSGGSNQLDLHNYKGFQGGSGVGKGLSMSQGMGIADSLLKIASTSVGLAKPTTDYDEWAKNVERYKNSAIRGLDDINTNEGLRQAYRTTPFLGSGLTGRDFRNKSWLSDISTNIATSFEGFNAGANTGNGWAAAIGAILGGVGSAVGIGVGRGKANKRAQWGNALIDKEVNPEINLALVNTGEKVDTINDRRRKKAVMSIPSIGGYSSAYGGNLDTHGADWDNGLTFIDLGGTHEENPYGGVFAGLAADGIPNLVEEDEVIWDDYVFSNRINVPEKLAKKYKLGGKITFAKAVRRLTEPSMERPNDPISKDTNNVILTEFKMAQEMERMKKEAQRQALINELIQAFSPEETPEEQEFQPASQTEEPQQVAPEQQGQGFAIPEEEPVEEPPIPGFAYGGHLFDGGGLIEKHTAAYNKRHALHERMLGDDAFSVSPWYLIANKLADLKSPEAIKNAFKGISEKEAKDLYNTLSPIFNEYKSDFYLPGGIAKELPKYDKKDVIEKIYSTIINDPVNASYYLPYYEEYKGDTQEIDDLIKNRAEQLKIDNPYDKTGTFFTDEVINKLREEYPELANAAYERNHRLINPGTQKLENVLDEIEEANKEEQRMERKAKKGARKETSGVSEPKSFNISRSELPKSEEQRKQLEKRLSDLGYSEDQIDNLLINTDNYSSFDVRSDEDLKALADKYLSDEFTIAPTTVVAEKGEKIPLGEEEDNVWDIGEDEPILDDINDIGIDKDYDTKPNRGGNSLADFIDEYRRNTNPVLEGSKVGSIYNYLRGPHDEEYDRMIGLGQEVGAPVSMPVATIGDYMQNKDFDSRYLVNLANANRMAAARTGMNTAAGNKAMNLAYASMLAHNNQQELGDIMKQEYLAERQDDSLVSKFNRETNATNMQALNTINSALAQLNSNRQIAGAGITERGLKGKHDAWTTWDTENGTNFTNYLENLNAAQNEQKEAQAINSIANLYGVSQNDDGTWSWEDDDSAKQFFASDLYNNYLKSKKAKSAAPIAGALGGKIRRRRRF